MMRTIVLLFTPLALLAACDQQEAGPVDSEVSPTSGADDEQTLPGERSLADEAPSGPTRAGSQLSVIPGAFTGVWDASSGSCDPASDLRMEIGSQDIIFYEARGAVESVTARNEASVSIDLAMEGEGETWDDTLVLSLSEDGNLLTPLGTEGDVGEPLVLTRCPD
ncbi:MAG: hypothetical protein V2J51_05650 [Erythrobacter sp.]|jgi:hypothetical protein|nr:hypothetical protein [Erythrobacter sp.]